MKPQPERQMRLMYCNIMIKFIFCGSWDGGSFVVFRIFKSILFSLIEFLCTFSIPYKILTDYVYYYSILIRIVYAVGTFFFRVPFTFFDTHVSPSSVFSLLTVSLFLSYLIFAVPIRKCLGKHSCMSSTFPISILNRTDVFWQCNYKCTMCIRSEKLEIVQH